MRLLALDLSTSTGYAVFDDGVLSSYGVVANERKVSSYGDYPWSLMAAVRDISSKIFEIIDHFEPDAIVIEEVTKSRNYFSQKALDWLHQSVLLFIEGTNKTDPRKIEVSYVFPASWRKALDLRLSKEDKKLNSKLSKAKANAKKTGSKLDKKTLGIRGRFGKKHVALRYVNETFGFSLKVKDDDIADAICLGLGFLKGAVKCDGK
ncbi:MAG: hypothetical protein NVS9B9_16510 [Ktedonobacteraceae bacterium]